MSLEFQSSELKQFKFKDTVFPRLRKKILYGFAILYVVLLVILFITEDPFNAPADAQSWIVFAVPVCVVALMALINIPRLLKRTKQYIDSYLITITPDSIIRDVHNTPSVLIRKAEIRSIEKDRKGNLVIRSAVSRDRIYIPHNVANRELLEQELAGASAAMIAKQKFSPALRSVIWLLVLFAALLTALGANNPYFGVGAAIVFVGMVVWSYFYIRNNKNVDYRSKRFLWVRIVIAIFLAAASVLRFFV